MVKQKKMSIYVNRIQIYSPKLGGTPNDDKESILILLENPVLLI